MGFKDGTNNIKAEDAAETRPVRLGRRRDRSAVDEGRQLPRHSPDPDADRVLGRRLPGRPGDGLRPAQGHRRAADRPVRVRPRRPRGAKRRTASLVIPADAHIRLAAPVQRTAVRRSCAAATPTPTASTRTTGQLDAGLFFIAFQKDPRDQFVPIQRHARPTRPAQRVHQARRQRVVRRAARVLRRRATGTASRCSPDLRPSLARVSGPGNGATPSDTGWTDSRSRVADVLPRIGPADRRSRWQQRSPVLSHDRHDQSTEQIRR